MFDFNKIIINNNNILSVKDDLDYTNTNYSIEGLELSDSDRLSDPIFKSVGYPSKIYYKNIRKFINLYTKEGATVLDSCCGSGSTGIAAILEKRKVILIDNSPEAINITFNMLNYLNLEEVNSVYEKLIRENEIIINKLYEILTDEGITGYADSIIHSNIYTCPNCGQDLLLYGSETGKRSEYECSCGYIFNISKHNDKACIKEKRVPVEATIVYKKDNKVYKVKKKLNQSDIEKLNETYQQYEMKYGKLWKPDEKIIYNRCYPRPGGWPGFEINSAVTELYTKSNVIALQILNNYIENEIVDLNIKAFFKFILTECLFRTSNRLFTTSGLKNVYQVPSLGKVQNVMTVFKRKYERIITAKEFLQKQITKELVDSNVRIYKSNAKSLNMENNSVDYAFIDPPYGGVVPYAELNLFYSAWLNEKEDISNEIIIPMDYEKKEEYVKKWGEQIEAAFKEVYRVLKPGAYFTIVFQSKFSDIWNILREIMNNKLGFEFVNIIKNERGTTFHTNQTNDTNPQSAFITYKKPIVYSKEKRKEKISDVTVFDIYPLDSLREPITLREVQTKIIYLVHSEKLTYVPSDDEIKQWLDKFCNVINEKYILKNS